MLMKSILKQNKRDTDNAHALCTMFNFDTEAWFETPIIDELFDVIEVEFDLEDDQIFEVVGLLSDIEVSVLNFDGVEEQFGELYDKLKGYQDERANK